jgi:hypothetical protein
MDVPLPAPPHPRVGALSRRVVAVRCSLLPGRRPPRETPASSTAEQLRHRAAAAALERPKRPEFITKRLSSAASSSSSSTARRPGDVAYNESSRTTPPTSFFLFEAREVESSEGTLAAPRSTRRSSSGHPRHEVAQLYTGWIGFKVMEQEIADGSRVSPFATSGLRRRRPPSAVSPFDVPAAGTIMPTVLVGILTEGARGVSSRRITASRHGHLAATQGRPVRFRIAAGGGIRRRFSAHPREAQEAGLVRRLGVPADQLARAPADPSGRRRDGARRTSVLVDACPTTVL